MSGGFGERSSASHKLRLFSLAVLCLMAIMLYILYLFNLQVVRGTEFQRRARDVSLRSAVIPAQRGEIYDRSFDVPLAINIPSFAVSITPAELSPDQRELIIPRLAELLGIRVEQIEAKLPPEYDHLYQPVEVASGVQLREISRNILRIFPV